MAGRLKGGCSQDWLPHKEIPELSNRTKVSGIVMPSCLTTGHKGDGLSYTAVSDFGHGGNSLTSTSKITNGRIIRITAGSKPSLSKIPIRYVV
jgi:hypothetical protein